MMEIPTRIDDHKILAQFARIANSGQQKSNACLLYIDAVKCRFFNLKKKK